MAIQRVRNHAMLQAIAAILSLLLLAGVFGNGMDTDDHRPARPTGSTDQPHAADFDGTP